MVSISMMLNKRSCKGFWSLRCDNETESPRCPTGINTMLEILRKLQKKSPEFFPIPPEAMKYKEMDYLLVFTSELFDEEIIQSAEAIRSYVDFPFIMLYYKKYAPDFKGEKTPYSYTPAGDLFKSCNGNNSAGCFWQLIGRKRKPAAALHELLPSQVTDRDHIHFPVKEEDFENATNEKGGKWILQCSDWNSMDNLWKNLIRLYDRGILVGLKSCTAKFSVTEIAPKYKTKAIMCYTADADCKSCVKRAAESIFICTGYDSIMYYKTNAASRTGQYSHEGCGSVSSYMFTGTGEMLERDYLSRWKKAVFDEEKHKETENQLC